MRSSPCPHRFRPLFALVLVVPLAVLLAGCAGLEYRAVMQEVEQNYYSGCPEASLASLNQIISENTGDKPLYLLERAVVLQRLGRFKEAQDDLMAADNQIEMLDFTNETAEEVARYTLSESLTRYRGQPHEKILLNTLNILNFLAEGDLNAARIEARRAGEQYDYQVETENRLHYVNALTMLLYGLVFDVSNQPNNAYVAYKKAFEIMGSAAAFLDSRLLYIARAIGHSDASRWAAQFGALPPPVPEGSGSLLVVVMNGRSPARVEQVIDIPAPLLTYDHDGVTLAALGKRTVRFAELMQRSHRFRAGRFRIDGGAPLPLAEGVDIEGQAIARFQEQRPQLIVSCVTRLLIRCVASTAIMSYVDHEMKKEGQPPSDFQRMIMESLLDSALAAIDIPDLRSWHLLPADILVCLCPVPAGPHNITLEMNGAGSLALQQEVSVEPGRLALAQFFVTD